MEVSTLERSFLNPPMFYRGTELWMLNDRLEDGELRRQIKEMSEKGFYSFIARTYVGLKSDYPGPRFMERMRTILDASREFGMKVFLQAGYMPGAVPDLPEEFALKKIITYRSTDSNQEGEMICCHDGICYRAVSSMTFLDMFNPAAVRFYMRLSYEEMWKQFQDEFGKTILSVWVDEPHYEKGYLPWSDILLERFRKKWRYDIQDKVYLLYVDKDDCITIRYHYWQTVQELMKEAYFTQVRDWCHEHNLLFSGHLMAEDTLKSQIEETCCVMPFYKYFDIPGIDFLTAEMNWRYNSIPWQYNTNPSKNDANERQNGLVNTPIQCVSAAHQAGKQDILCEMFGCSTQNLTFRDQKYLFDHFASLGINHKCVHALFYSLRGRRKRAYPPHINYYQPYWEQYKLANDYFARASWFVSQGKPVRDIVIVHPIDSSFCEYHGSSVIPMPNTDLERRDKGFLALLQNLLACQCGFELGDEDTICEWGHVDDQGYMQLGEMRYRIMVLPDLRTIRSSTLALLEKFAQTGGKTYILGRVPDHIDGLPDSQVGSRILALPGVVRIKDQNELIGCLDKYDKSYLFKCNEDTTSIQLNYRRDDDRHYFFFFNRDCREARTGQLTVTGKLQAIAWDGKDGSRQLLPVIYNRENNRTVVDIRIEEGGALMLSLEEAEDLQSVKTYQTETVACLPVKGSWVVTRKDPNILLMEFCRYRKDIQDDWSPLYPVLAIQDKLTQEDYIGPIHLSFPFNTAIALSKMRLALESPAECTIMLDGQLVGNQADGYFMAKEFECVALPMTIHPGRHQVEISRFFRPLAKAKNHLTSLFEDLPGVELEAIYLIGDFAVMSRAESTNTNCIRMNRDFELCRESNRYYTELVSAGYPFYAGTIVLRKTVELPDNLVGNGKAWLEADGFRACAARVYVNENYAGVMAWAPYRVDITGLLKQGENTISIELTNTLRNMLGPYHRPKGELGTCFFHGYDNYNLPWIGAYDYSNRQRIPDWADHRDIDTPGWTEAYMQVSFGIGDIRLMVT